MADRKALLAKPSAPAKDKHAVPGDRNLKTSPG